MNERYVFEQPPLVEFDNGAEIAVVGALAVRMLADRASIHYALRDWELPALPRGMRNNSRRSAIDAHVRAAMQRHPDYIEIVVILRGGTTW